MGESAPTSTTRQREEPYYQLARLRPIRAGCRLLGGREVRCSVLQVCMMDRAPGGQRLPCLCRTILKFWSHSLGSDIIDGLIAMACEVLAQSSVRTLFVCFVRMAPTRRSMYLRSWGVVVGFSIRRSNYQCCLYLRSWGVVGAAISGLAAASAKAS